MSARQLAQVQTEALSTPVPGPEVAATAAEVLSTPLAGQELTALVQEYVASVQPASALAQALVESLATVQPAAEVGQLLLEALSALAPSQRADEIQLLAHHLEVLRANAGIGAGGTGDSGAGGAGGAGGSAWHDVFAFAHDWSVPLLERLEWQTSVARTASGGEVRRPGRSHPRRSITYQVGTGRPSDALVADWLADHLGRPAWFGLPQHSAYLSRAAAAGATRLELAGLDARHFGPPAARLRLERTGMQHQPNAERRALLLAADGWHSLRIQAIEADAMHLLEPLPAAVPAGSRVMPLVWGQASDPAALTQLLPGVASGSVRAQLGLAPAPAADPAHADPQLAGIPVWPDGNWHADPNATIDAAVTAHDLSPAQPWLRRDDPWTLNTLQRRYLAASSAAIDAWRARLWRAQGRLGDFWLPDGLAPVLRLVHDFVEDEGWLQVDAEPLAWLWTRSAGCLILLPDGQRQHALIGPIQAESGAAVLPLQTPLQAHVPAGSRLIRLQRCRLDHDAVDLHWHAPQLLEIALTMRQLPPMATAAALAWPSAAMPALHHPPAGAGLSAPPRPPQFQCPPPPRTMERAVFSGSGRMMAAENPAAGGRPSAWPHEWIVPDGVTEIWVSAVGAGGEGGSSQTPAIHGIDSLGENLEWPGDEHLGNGVGWAIGGHGAGGGGAGESVIRQRLEVQPGGLLRLHVFDRRFGERAGWDNPSGLPRAFATPTIIEYRENGERFGPTQARIEVRGGQDGGFAVPDTAIIPIPYQNYDAICVVGRGGAGGGQDGRLRNGAAGGEGGDGGVCELAGHPDFADLFTGQNGAGGSSPTGPFIVDGINFNFFPNPNPTAATNFGAGGGGGPGYTAPTGLRMTFLDFPGQRYLVNYEALPVDGTFGRVHSDSNRNLLGFHPTPARHGGPGLAVIEWYAPEPDPQSHSSL